MARFDLGLTEAEFGWITPRLMDALYRRNVQAKRLERFPFGVLASVFANFGFCAPKKPLRPEDFGFGIEARRAPMTTKLSVEDVAAQWRVFLAPRKVKAPEGAEEDDAQ